MAITKNIYGITIGRWDRRTDLQPGGPTFKQSKGNRNRTHVLSDADRRTDTLFRIVIKFDYTNINLKNTHKPIKIKINFLFRKMLLSPKTFLFSNTTCNYFVGEFETQPFMPKDNFSISNIHICQGRGWCGGHHIHMPWARS